MKLTKRTKSIILWARQWAEYCSDEEILEMWENDKSLFNDYSDKEFQFDLREKSSNE